MRPVEFDGMNGERTKPVDMTDEQCLSLPCFRADGQVISCWKLDDEEIAEIVKTRHLWVSVHSGHTSPPIALSPSRMVCPPDCKCLSDDLTHRCCTTCDKEIKRQPGFTPSADKGEPSEA